VEEEFVIKQILLILVFIILGLGLIAQVAEMRAKYKERNKK
jgi:hypothetical protein